jgi:hypothetical protein
MVGRTVGLVGILVVLGCEDSPRFSADAVLNEVIAADAARSIVVDIDLPIDVEGRRNTDDVNVTGTVTVTTSSQAVSDDLAENLTVQGDLMGGELTLTLAAPDAGTPLNRAEVRGNLLILVPNDVDLEVDSSRGIVSVVGIQGAIRVSTVGEVRVEGAEDDLFVSTTVGGAEVQTRAAPSTLSEVEVATGNVVVTLPPVLSSRIQGLAVNGVIRVDHPQLPPPSTLPGLPYNVIVGPQLSRVSVTVQRGDILFRD